MRTLTNHQLHHHRLTRREIHHHQMGLLAHQGGEGRQEEVGDHLGHPAGVGTHQVTPLKVDQVLVKPLLREAGPQEEAEAPRRAVAREVSLKQIQNLMMDWHHPDILHGLQ